MVKTPRTRHSKSRREPLTIELDPADVARVPEGEGVPSTAPEAESPDSILAAADEAPEANTQAPDAAADEPLASASESDFATETGTAAQPEQEYQPAEALQEATGSRLDEAEQAEPDAPGPQAPSVAPPAQPRRDRILPRGRRPHRRGCGAGRCRRPAICGPARRSRREFGRRTRRRRNREPASGDRGGKERRRRGGSRRTDRRRRRRP